MFCIKSDMLYIVNLVMGCNTMFNNISAISWRLV